MFKKGCIILGSVLAAYAISMVAIRLHIIELGYRFEELKDSERSLREEQAQMRAETIEKLSPSKLKLEGFQEPRPDQVVVLP